ncbi:MAG: DNA mismatch endonuclease Vsr [Phycisphaerae bacterium]|nr:DNA mismatch endonuclease Vsr [Phycisphaerae bacterium]
MDKYDRKTRSRMMASVRSRGNQTTELKMISLLRENGLHGWRRHCPLPGTPDFCWRKRKVALFVDGCFWHGCPYCRRAPKSNTRFWEKKIEDNIRRDRRVNRILRSRGWHVLRVRECKITDRRTIHRIKRLIASPESKA